LFLNYTTDNRGVIIFIIIAQLICLIPITYSGREHRVVFMTQHRVWTCLGVSWRRTFLFCETLTRCIQRTRDCLIMRWINLHFTYHVSVAEERCHIDQSGAWCEHVDQSGAWCEHVDQSGAGCECRRLHQKWWYCAHHVATTRRPIQLSLETEIQSLHPWWLSVTAASMSLRTLCLSSREAWHHLVLTTRNTLFSFLSASSLVSNTRHYVTMAVFFNLLSEAEPFATI